MNRLYITRLNTFSVTRKQTQNQGMIIRNMTKLKHVKITLYIDDTKKKNK